MWCGYYAYLRLTHLQVQLTLDEAASENAKGMEDKYQYHPPSIQLKDISLLNLLQELFMWKVPDYSLVPLLPQS